MKFSVLAILLSGILSASGGTPAWELPGDGQNKDGVMRVTATGKDGNRIAFLPLSASEMAGRMYRLSAEIRGTGIVGKKHGGKLMFALKTPDKNLWYGLNVPSGTYGWTRLERTFRFPADLQSGRLMFGLQDASGTIEMRNLCIDDRGIPLDLKKQMNRSLADSVAGDGKGGWSDQGPFQDGATFRKAFYRKDVGQIPFDLIPEGNSVLAMKSEYAPEGPASVTVRQPLPREAKMLYVLHTLCWAKRDGGEFGEIRITGEKGTQTISLKCGTDAADWFTPNALPNGGIGIRGTLRGGTIGIYVSKFKVNPEIGKIRSTEFRSPGGATLWLIAGATFADADYPFPKSEPFTVAAGKTWVPLANPENMEVVSGSALDLGAYLPKERAGVRGRVVATAPGRLAFASDPAKPVRFFCKAVENFRFRDHAEIDRYVDEIRRNGYNMYRTHFLDNALLLDSKEDLAFSPKILDNFDYLVHALKQNGIYIAFDGMTSWNGYYKGNCWRKGVTKDMKNVIHFSRAARENWTAGVKKLLHHVNPYTKTRLIDDPILALIVGFNEQEFGFLSQFPAEPTSSEWRNYLKKRYGTLEAWKKTVRYDTSWIRKWEDVPVFLPGAYRGDVEKFVRAAESNTFDWYREELRKLGFPGLVSNYNTSKSNHYNVIRGRGDFVSMNHYHAHPQNVSLISQASSLGYGGVIPLFASARLSGKPFVITEHNHVFWNRFRYEQGLSVGAFAALQDYDGLTAHAARVSMLKPSPLRPFKLKWDPIAHASEFLTFCAYQRGDVSPSKHSIRITADPARLEREDRMNEAVPPALYRLALVERISLDYSSNPAPERSGELVIPLTGGAKSVTDVSGFSTVTGGKMDSSDLLALLKKKKFLPESNRSDGKSIFESSTGELLVDLSRNFMSVDTPRLQGVAAAAGTVARMKDFQIREMSVNGTFAATAMDGLRPIRSAARLVLVFATNALNSGTVFENKDMCLQIKPGTLPVLLETGRIAFTLKNEHAEKLKLYALDLSGRRLAEIPLEKKIAGEVSAAFDTARYSGALFYELTAR